MSDLAKEKELAERRKNDPVLNTSQDHLVRKLFSKFKKTSGADLTSPHNIGGGSIVAAEHGTGGSGIQVQTGNNANNVANDGTVSSPNASDLAKQRKLSLALGVSKPRTIAGGGGGWARLLVHILKRFTFIKLH